MREVRADSYGLAYLKQIFHVTENLLLHQAYIGERPFTGIIKHCLGKKSQNISILWHVYQLNCLTGPFMLDSCQHSDPVTKTTIE